MFLSVLTNSAKNLMNKLSISVLAMPFAVNRRTNHKYVVSRKI